MLGGEPILSADGERAGGRQGRPSYVTSAGSGPSVGKHLLMAYLPPRCRVEGSSLLVEYMGEQYPVTVARATHAAVRPGERADQELRRVMDILVCVKRVPTVGGKIAVTAGRAGDRHPGVRVLDQPARGVRGRGGGADHRAGRRLGLRADPRSRRRRSSSCATRCVALGARRAVLLETDGREFGPIATAGRHRRRGPGASATTWSLAAATRRPTPATTRSASGSRTSSAGRSPPGSEPVPYRTAPWSARREYRGRGGGVLAAAARRGHASRRASTCPATRRCPGGCAKRAQVDRSSPEWAAEGLRKSAPPGARVEQAPGRGAG